MNTAKFKVGTIAIGVQGDHTIETWRDRKGLRGLTVRLLPCVSVTYFRGMERNFVVRIDACWLVLSGAIFVERMEGCRF